MRRAGNEELTSIANIVDIIVHQDEFDLLAEVGDECGTFQTVPESLWNYIDYEAYGRDIRLERIG